MNSEPEQRLEHRLNESVMIFIETPIANPGSEEPAQVTICSTLNLSANGVQIALDFPLPRGAIYQLCAQHTPSQTTLYLSAEVKWCSAVEDQHHIGLQLFESEDTDIIAWKKLVADFLAD